MDGDHSGGFFSHRDDGGRRISDRGGTCPLFWRRGYVRAFVCMRAAVCIRDRLFVAREEIRRLPRSHVCPVRTGRKDRLLYAARADVPAVRRYACRAGRAAAQLCPFAICFGPFRRLHFFMPRAERGRRAEYCARSLSRRAHILDGNGRTAFFCIYKRCMGCGAVCGHERRVFCARSDGRGARNAHPGAILRPCGGVHLCLRDVYSGRHPCGGGCGACFSHAVSDGHPRQACLCGRDRVFRADRALLGALSALFGVRPSRTA